MWRHLRKRTLLRKKYHRPWSDAAHDARRLIRAFDSFSAIRFLFADDVTYWIYSVQETESSQFQIHDSVLQAIEREICILLHKIGSKSSGRTLGWHWSACFYAHPVTESPVADPEIKFPTRQGQVISQKASDEIDTIRGLIPDNE